MNVYSYVRVSSRGQIEGDGPERQRDAIKAFCSEHKLQARGEFFEKGVSGTVEGLDRPAFADMLERAEHMINNGIPIGAIVVERLDRLARDLMVSEVLLSECRKRGLHVYSVDQGNLQDMAADGGDPTRVLIRQIMGALAQWEKTTLVRKLKLSRDRKKASTGRCEGQKPFGHYPKEREVLKFIGQLILGGSSCETICGWLNQGGFMNRRGRPWVKTTVQRLIEVHFPEHKVPLTDSRS